ncbi:hypothetical protein DAEQUDRAFT_347312 [Daedalea quercina L-15889]|uniref:Uncharacterized protein n=1 Tax=Daedalea quercina L-15889 TaxID=1314783 RepID=A0A165PCU0_9APHY|nr:hypothetical protein DAEQUDRAFT_347312 [Daedalea quercina L-15889]
MPHIFSFSQLQRFIHSFPALREVILRNDPTWDPPEVSAETGLHRTDLSADAWPRLKLWYMSSAVTLRFLELFTTQHPKVQRLCIHVLGLRSSALLQAVEEVLRESGPALAEFEWFASSYNQIALDPVPRLMYNTNLETLQAQIFVLTISRACTSLMALFSHIKSTHMYNMLIQLDLGRLPLDDMDLSVEGSTESITAFHAILCRPVFAGLPTGAMKIFFKYWNMPSDDEPSAINVASARIQTIMVLLLTPWFVRGVLQLQLPNGSLVEGIPPNFRSAGPSIEDDSSIGNGALRGLAG